MAWKAWVTREGILRASQTVISLRKLKFSERVHAFTAHGAFKAVNILNRLRTVARMSIRRRSELCGSDYLSLTIDPGPDRARLR
jgi:hypothetical protein